MVFVSLGTIEGHGLPGLPQTTNAELATYNLHLHARHSNGCHLLLWAWYPDAPDHHQSLNSTH